MDNGEALLAAQWRDTVWFSSPWSFCALALHPVRSTCATLGNCVPYTTRAWIDHQPHKADSGAAANLFPKGTRSALSYSTTP